MKFDLNPAHAGEEAGQEHNEQCEARASWVDDGASGRSCGVACGVEEKEEAGPWQT